MKIEGKMRQSGSAIIIAFLLMAVVSGTAFAIARLFYLDTAAGGLYENSTVAYYAAESGIEEGMLRYRFNRNAEVAAAKDEDYLDFTNVSRSNLVLGTVGSAATAFNQSQQVYDLNMAYKAKYYGTDIDNSAKINFADINDPAYESQFIVPRDESVKIDITDTFGNTGSGDLDFLVKLGEPSSGMTDDDAFIEAKITGYVGGQLKEFKKALIPTGTYGSRQWSSETYYPMPTAIGSTPSDRVYQVDGFKNKIVGATNFDLPTVDKRVFLYLKPIGYDQLPIGYGGSGIAIGLNPTSTGDAISAPYTTVKSTGYFGGVGRTLTAKIDRQSGTVYDIFDFVVYQHN